jgi:hypothetical protein
MVEVMQAAAELGSTQDVLRTTATAWASRLLKDVGEATDAAFQYDRIRLGTPGFPPPTKFRDQLVRTMALSLLAVAWCDQQVYVEDDRAS